MHSRHVGRAGHGEHRECARKNICSIVPLYLIESEEVGGEAYSAEPRLVCHR